MNQPERAKTSVRKKAPAAMKAGTQKRQPIKKTFCSKCCKLVKGQIQESKSGLQVSCPKCSQRLWFWENTSWRSAGKATTST